MRAAFLFVVLASTGLSFAQIAAPSAAQAKLQALEAERAAERAKPAQITVGELEDLQLELKRLRAALAAATASPSPAAAARRRTMIEIGMTRDEVIAFVKLRPKELAIGEIRTQAGGEQVTRTRERVITSGTKSADETVFTDGRVVNAPGTGNTARDSSENSHQSTIRESGVLRNKTEIWNIMRMQPVYDTIVTGRNIAGGAERQRVMRGYRSGGTAYRLTLVNDVVTEVQALAGI